MQLADLSKNQNSQKNISISRASSRVYSLNEIRASSKDKRRSLLKPAVNGEEK